MKILNLFLVLAFFALILGSCSKGSSPVTPEGASDHWQVRNIPVAESNNPSGENPYRGVLGAWKVHIDVETMTAELVPARNAKAIGNIFDADLSQFLTVSPCSNCMAITGLDVLWDDNLKLDFQMKHPFPDIAKRPDLHGFDVRAIFISEADNTVTSSLKVMRPDGTEEDAEYQNYFVLNADGLTSHYDELVNDPRYFIDNTNCPGNLNPYLRFFEDPSTGTFNPNAPAGHNVMPTGSPKYKRSAVLNKWFGYDNKDFYIVADIAYGQSAVFANRTNPQYYLPSFNRTEPWRMEYWLENNTLNYNDANSSVDLFVQVFDWQHAATVDPNYPNPANLAGLRESSKVAKVELLMPTLKATVIESTTSLGGDGSPTNPLLYKFTIKNELLGYSSIHTGLIAIRDELYGAAAPSGRSNIPEVPAGFPYDTLDIRDYAYYGVIRINMPDIQYGENLYKNEISVNQSTLYGQSSGRPELTFFMDPSGQKFLYEWDFDYRNSTFDVDATGMPCPYIDFTDPLLPGRRIVGFRVTTNSVPPKQYVYEIPVYARGLEYLRTLPVNGATDDATSTRQSHAVVATEDRLYIAYVTKDPSGIRNIEIAAIERYSDGEITSVQITDATTEAYYDPVMVVIEEGANAGVYVTFTKRATPYDNICFNSGNLDLSGFDPANVVKVTDSPTWNTDSCIVKMNDILVTYYAHRQTVPTPSTRIHRVESIDWGQTWTNDVEIDDSSDSQEHPSAAYLEWPDSIFCVWEDNRNEAEYGIDLYLERYDGTNAGFYNISNSRGDTDEISPSVATFSETVGVAYVEVDSAGNSVVRLKNLRVGSTPGIDNYIAGASFPNLVSSPSLAICADNQFTIAYSFYNPTTTELKVTALQCYESSMFGDLQYQFIENTTVGNMPVAEGGNAFVSVACRRVAGGYGIEHYVVQKSYMSGFEENNTPFKMFFGKIEALCYITHGDMNDPN
jgi:hypothetical protein